MDQGDVLQSLYDREINYSISTFFDEGFTVALGDEMNGFKAQATVDTLDDAIQWLQEQAAIHFPANLKSE
jgi:hypothetical protein